MNYVLHKHFDTERAITGDDESGANESPQMLHKARSLIESGFICTKWITLTSLLEFVMPNDFF